MVNVLFIGDIVGQGGLNLVADLFPRMRHLYSVDFAIANGENARGGKDITTAQARKLHDIGIDVITTGNHVWDLNKDNALDARLPYLIRPANYPEDNKGEGMVVQTNDKNITFVIMNMQGRGFMTPIDCPFHKTDSLLAGLETANGNRIILVDMHAESSAEKQAYAWYLDGKVSAVVGTHTHVQTADERILNRGTAYITDVGMTGPYNSVIGMKIDKAIQRFRTQTPVYYEMAEGDLRLSAVLLSIDERSGKTNSIKRLNFSKEEFSRAAQNH
jgi:metallophosphoesterase (TIGR00282 family)